jgi:hypothetical protein
MAAEPVERRVLVDGMTGRPMVLPTPVSLAWVGGPDLRTDIDRWLMLGMRVSVPGWLAVCNYSDVALVDLRVGRGWVLKRPAGLPAGAEAWNPTGLFSAGASSGGASGGASGGRLWVANYKGGDVLALEVVWPGDGGSGWAPRVRLRERIVHPAMLGPEGVAVAADGRVAVADYDGNALLMFDAGGELLWRREALRAHGVCFAEDGRLVLVTALHTRQLTAYDASGEQVYQRGREGWLAGEHLWPTTLAPAGDGRHVLLADPHQGTVRTVEAASGEPVAVVGGNGVGPGLLNMPYGVVATPGGWVVADTFNHRLVTVDREGRAGVSLALGPREGPMVGKARAAWEPTRARQPNLHGIGYVGYTHVAQTVVLPGGLAEQLGVARRWHPAYGRLVAAGAPAGSEDPADTLMVQHSPFHGRMFRFVQAANVRHASRDWLVLHSPQATRLLCVRDDGLLVPVNIPGGLWLDADGGVAGLLIGGEPGEVLDLRPQVAKAGRRAAAYEAAAAAGDRDAVVRLLLPGTALAVGRRMYDDYLAAGGGGGAASGGAEGPVDLVRVLVERLGVR